MQPRSVYLLLCLVGTVIPCWQIVPWLLVHGLNVRLFFDQLFANRIGAFFGADVFISAAVVCVFAGFERKRLGSKWWLPLVAVFTVGVSAALPLLLYLREGNGSGKPPVTS